ncbi:MAG: TRAP transporter small permease [Comamonadaceae bacterium]|jgi:TRAP-type C4-dicarboxylate transport system permease small subunit|uniref:TRAP transporter small permease protein n=1 Tax=Hydrogenophaga borbori TaxID=2294117 RepID=A0A372EPX3_9BURK|nr:MULTISPECIES: TRAP transporter small permease [Hydrogenophaga]NCT95886.1 TRAP transporter small permease [Comamonadaceae bacterium]RFP82602.1 TRAP transporter small permease [Hydrogenophaga borbori]WQB82201.1 TRAP transporter small permease [Hydrogenophaga sp. SNF1]
MSYEANTNLEEAPVPTAPSSPFGHVVDALNGLGSIVIALVMVLMCADVFMRNAFNHPLDGVAEMVAASIIVIVFLQLPATLRHGRMSRADLFIDPFVARRPKAGKRLRAVFSLAGVFASGVIAYATWPLFQRAWANNEFFGVEGVFTFPTWPMRIVVFVGAALAALQYALLAWQDWRESAAAEAKGGRP